MYSFSSSINEANLFLKVTTYENVYNCKISCNQHTTQSKIVQMCGKIHSVRIQACTPSNFLLFHKIKSRKNRNF